MPWGRIDDSLYDHPKLDLIPLEHRLATLGLLVRCISWCNRFRTDGHVPRERIAKLDGTIELADRLVVAGMFEPNGSGYLIHDFLDYNDSREQIDERRRKEAERKAEWRDKKRHSVSPTGTPSANGEVVPPSVPPGQTDLSQRVSRDSRGRSARESRPGPARPDPYLEKVPRSGTSTREADVEGTLLTVDELAAWGSFGSDWDEVKAAWLARGLRLPPTGEPDEEGSQRAVLFEVLDARPNDLVRWISEAPATSGRLTGHDVIRHVLRQWHASKAVKAEVAL
jgi:hypothetical protein